MTWIEERQRFVMAIERGEHAGSGLLIGNEGLVLTARALVDGPSTLRVRAYAGEHFAAKVVAFDGDLAVLKIMSDYPPRGLATSELGGVTQIELGQTLIILSLPIGSRNVGMRKLPAVQPPMPAFLRAIGVEPDRVYAEGRFGLGAVGAAVFTQDGSLLGVNTGDPTLPFMLGRVAAAHAVLEKAKHPERQPAFRPKASRALEGGLGVTFGSGSGGIGVDDRFGFRRNHLLLSIRATLTWDVIEPERSSVFVERSRFFVMPSVGATWKLHAGSLSTSLGAAVGSVQRKRVFVTPEGTRSESDDQGRLRPMLDVTHRDGLLFVSGAAELWREPTLFLSIGLGMETVLTPR